MLHTVAPAKAGGPAGERLLRSSPPGSPAFAGATKALIAAFLLAAPAAAQVDRPDYVRALAAGYKASFLCSDIFNAGQTEAQVARDDLKRIYPELEPLIPGLEARIDREAKTVSVAFDDRLPPRIAAWRPHLGCAQLPIGASAGCGPAAAQAGRHPGGRPQRPARLARRRPQRRRQAQRRRQGAGPGGGRRLRPPHLRRRGARRPPCSSSRTAGSSPSATAPISTCTCRSAPGRSPRASPAHSSAPPSSRA